MSASAYRTVVVHGEDATAIAPANTIAATKHWNVAWDRTTRWTQLLPFRWGYVADLRRYVRGVRAREGPQYLGHNPIGRLMVTLLLLMLFTQAVTGLVLAGTDLYKLPFSGMIAEWLTAGDAEKLRNLTPGSKEFVDQTACDDIRRFRKPIVTTC